MSVPGGWVRLELEDLGQHSAVAAYPALRYSTVQYSTVQYSITTSSSATRLRLVTWRCSGGCPRHHQPRRRGEWGSSCRIIQRRWGSSLLYFIPVTFRLHIYVINFSLNISYFQIRRLTVLSVSEKDVYMFDMVQLLSNFQFGG